MDSLRYELTTAEIEYVKRWNLLYYDLLAIGDALQILDDLSVSWSSFENEMMISPSFYTAIEDSLRYYVVVQLCKYFEDEKKTEVLGIYQHLEWVRNNLDLFTAESRVRRRDPQTGNPFLPSEDDLIEEQILRSGNDLTEEQISELRQKCCEHYDPSKGIILLRNNILAHRSASLLKSKIRARLEASPITDEVIKNTFNCIYNTLITINEAWDGSYDSKCSSNISDLKGTLNMVRQCRENSI